MRLPGQHQEIGKPAWPSHSVKEKDQDAALPDANNMKTAVRSKKLAEHVMGMSICVLPLVISFDKGYRCSCTDRQRSSDSSVQYHNWLVQGGPRERGCRAIACSELTAVLFADHANRSPWLQYNEVKSQSVTALELDMEAIEEMIKVGYHQVTQKRSLLSTFLQSVSLKYTSYCQIYAKKKKRRDEFEDSSDSFLQTVVQPLQAEFDATPGGQDLYSRHFCETPSDRDTLAAVKVRSCLPSAFGR